MQSIGKSGRLSASLLERLRTGFDRWLRRRARMEPPLVLYYRQIFVLPTAFGWLLGLLMFAMLMGSLNFNNNLGLLTTFIVAGIAHASLLAGFRNLQGLQIAGTRGDAVFAGKALELGVRLADTAGRGRSGVVVRCGPEAAAADLAPDGSALVTLHLPTRRRGRYSPGRLRLESRHPLGLFEVWSWFWPEREFLVWPRPARNPPPLPVSADRGGRRRPGDETDEFHGLRDWREGDPLHRIAWKASQRHQSLLARQFTRNENEEIRLSPEQVPVNDPERRLSVLAAWILEAERRELRYSLAIGGEEIGPGSGAEHRVRCLNLLALQP